MLAQSTSFEHILEMYTEHQCIRKIDCGEHETKCFGCFMLTKTNYQTNSCFAMYHKLRERRIMIPTRHYKGSVVLYG